MHPIVQLCMATDEHVEAQYPNQENSCRLLPRFYQGSAQTASDALDGRRWRAQDLPTVAVV